MIAGFLKYRLRILKPEIEKDAFGAEHTTWVETKVAHAERVKTSGSNRLEVGEHFPDYRPEFNIRDAHEIDENWRVQQIDGHLYTVRNVIPNKDRGMLTLQCERVNE